MFFIDLFFIVHQWIEYQCVTSVKNIEFCPRIIHKDIPPVIVKQFIQERPLWGLAYFSVTPCHHDIQVFSRWKEAQQNIITKCKLCVWNRSCFVKAIADQYGIHWINANKIQVTLNAKTVEWNWKIEKAALKTTEMQTCICLYGC